MDITIQMDPAQVAQMRQRWAKKYARKQGKWPCPGKCGRTISANKDFCAECGRKKEQEQAT